MNKLPENFEYHQYGIDVRLANEDDSAFILSLRTNPIINKFIHSTDSDLEKQREWMKQYKKREQEGLDYYFIYSLKGKSFGLDRVYNVNIEDNSYTGGSWICVPGTDMDLILRQVLSNIDIVNNYLCLNVNRYDVRKENKKVLRFHRQVLNAKEIGDTDLDILFYTDMKMRSEVQRRLEKFL